MLHAKQERYKDTYKRRKASSGIQKQGRHKFTYKTRKT